MVKEIFAVRATVLASSPQPAPSAVSDKPSAPPATAPRSQTARETMNLPTRVSAASSSSTAPVAKSDAPDFKLAPARIAAALVAATRTSRSAGAGVPGVGGRSGASGRSSGNDYFPPEEDEESCPVCQVSTTRSGQDRVKRSGAVCKRIATCKLVQAP